MAFVKKIRTKSAHGFLVLTVLLLIAMLLSGDVGRTVAYFWASRRDRLGTLNGRPIRHADYQPYLARMYRTLEAQGRQPDAAEQRRLQAYAWRRCVEDLRCLRETQKAAISVGTQERIDLVQGTHVDPGIQASFQNPETQTFDKQRLRAYLRNLKTPEERAGWCAFEQMLAAQRAKQKLIVLMQKSHFLPTMEREQEALRAAERCDVDYLYFPFEQIPDEAVAPTRQQLTDYLRAHSERYKSEERACRIAYVSFPIEPSAEDQARFRDGLHALTAAFAAASDALGFAKQHTDGAAADAYLACPAGALPPALQACKHALQKGMLVGPTEAQKGSVYLYKVVDVAPKEGTDWYQLAVVEKRMLPGSEVRKQVAQAAERFVAEARQKSGLAAAAKQAKKRLHRDELHPSSTSVGPHAAARAVVQWAFQTAAAGTVSNPFLVGDAYLVVGIVEEVQQGQLLPLEKVYSEVYAKVQNEAKAKLILDRLSQIRAETLEETAAQYGTNFEVRSKKGLSYQPTDDPFLQAAPIFVGACFGLPIGTIGKPIVDQTGVFLPCVRRREQMVPQNGPDRGGADASERRYELERWMQTYYVDQALEETMPCSDERYRWH